MKKRLMVVLLFLALLVYSCTSSPSIKECEKYKSVTANETCITNVALKSRDHSICKQGPPSCYFIMWLEFADEAICRDVEDLQRRDRCYRDVASIKKDIALCRQIVEQREKDRCINLASRSLGTTVYCNEIANISSKDTCFATYYPGKNIDECNLVTDKALRDDCPINIALNERNYSLCDSMALPLKDKCYNFVATHYGDIEKCSFILLPELRDYCINLSGEKNVAMQQVG